MHTLIAAAKTFQMNGQTWLGLVVMFVGASLSAIGARRQMQGRGKVGLFAVGGLIVAFLGILLILGGK